MGARVQSGLPGLDKLLEGGFLPGKVVLVLGEPGTGQNILASQYLMWGLTKAHENGVFILQEHLFLPRRFRRRNILVST